MLTVIMILLGIAVLLLLDGILENYFPIAKRVSHTIKKIKEDKTALLLTELHACCRGRKKDKYVQMIQRQNPDMLLIAGGYDGEKWKTYGECDSVFERNRFRGTYFLCTRQS